MRGLLILDPEIINEIKDLAEWLEYTLLSIRIVSNDQNRPSVLSKKVCDVWALRWLLVDQDCSK